MKYIAFLLFVFLLGSNTTAYSQDQSSRQNAIKINILPPILSSTGEISYERIVKPNLGVVIGIGRNFRSDQSDFQLSSDSNIEFADRNIQNRYLLAEVRRYINFCGSDCKAPHGFYAGGFMRYNQLDFFSNPRFQSGNTNLDFDIGLSSLNFGALFGYQINLYNWLIDFEFGGLGQSVNWIEFNSSSELSNEALANLSDTLNENFGIGGDFEGLTLNESSAKLSFWSWTFRYAISVGYNF